MIQYLNDSMTQSSLIIDDALGVQLLQKCLDIGADLVLRREDELCFQLLDNFSHREMSIAELENDAARSFHADRAFREEHDRSFGGSTPAASRGKLRNARIAELSHGSPQFEKLPAAASPVRHTRNRARRAAPKECRTCRAMPG